MTAPHPAATDDAMVTKIRKEAMVEITNRTALIAQAETPTAVNLLGTIRVIDAFIPHLIERGGGDIITVSSGIGSMPFPPVPTYGASKAGVHAYTESLRPQLAGTSVEVTEFVPPAIATVGQEKVNPAALSLDAFLDEVLQLLTKDPAPNEVVVERALPLRWAKRDGTYAELLERRSQSLSTLLGR